MTPAARLQATIEALCDIEGTHRPARHTISRYLRQRRYIGAKDRRYIRNNFFNIIRDQLRLDWKIRKAKAEPSPRSRVLAHSVLTGTSLDEIKSTCAGTRYAPQTLNTDEINWLSALIATIKIGTQDEPNWVVGNYPSWLEPELNRSFGEDLLAEMLALDSSAPTDLRVNETKANRKKVLQALQAQGIKAQPTPLAPNGVRLFDRPAILSGEFYQNGLIEIQDEGAQLVAGLVDVEPDHHIVDFCAGAGGKTLALATKVSTHGEITACDTNPARLKKIKPRLRRAGVRNVKIHLLTTDDAWLIETKASSDRVLVDVPCSGTGTWRREPDARHRLTPTLLASYEKKQRAILDAACRLVKPGGRLIYATCSILRSENQDQVDRFLRDHSNFSIIPVSPICRKILKTEDISEQPTLQLTPRRHGVDGFFVAIFERTG